MNIRKIFMDSLRLYFAPLVGAFNAVKDEIKRRERERELELEREREHA